MFDQKANIMDINDNIESPLNLKISFNMLLKHYETLANSNDKFISEKSRRILKIAEAYPELRSGLRVVPL